MVKVIFRCTNGRWLGVNYARVDNIFILTAQCKNVAKEKGMMPVIPLDYRSLPDAPKRVSTKKEEPPKPPMDQIKFKF